MNKIIIEINAGLQMCFKKISTMSKQKYLLILAAMFIMSACSPKVSKTITTDNAVEIVEEAAADWDYALLHIYRRSGPGAFVGYDIHLGDEVICRAKNKWKTTITVRNFGQNTIWASTESKTEIPVNIERGREYYIRCGMKMGIVVGRPSLELVNKKTGKPEFDSIKN